LLNFAKLICQGDCLSAYCRMFHLCKLFFLETKDNMRVLVLGYKFSPSKTRLNMIRSIDFKLNMACVWTYISADRLTFEFKNYDSNRMAKQMLDSVVFRGIYTPLILFYLWFVIQTKTLRYQFISRNLKMEQNIKTLFVFK
jgi:hypothetical protein